MSYGSVQDEPMFRPDEKEKEGQWKNHGMNRAFFQRLYKSVPKEVMRSTEGGVCWIESSGKRPKGFVGLVKLFYDQTLTTLESTEVVVYQVQVASMNVSPSGQLWFVENGLTLLGYLPVIMK